MHKRRYTWVVVVTLLSGFLSIASVSSAQAASATTTSATISDSTPKAGDTVVFTVTITPTTFNSPITGNVVIAHTRGELCATSTLIESDPATHAVTATCSWVARLGSENVLATFKGDSNYSASNSAYFSGLNVIGVLGLSIPRISEGGSMTLKSWTNADGSMAFKVNGISISGCETKSVTTNTTVSCTYSLPVSNNAQNATKIFSVDFTPTSKSIILDAYSKSYTPDSYYLPSGGNIFQSTVSNFSNANSAQPFRDSGYVEIGHIFYKLNRSTLEAMVVGYDRFAGISQLVIPDSLKVLSANVSNQAFVGNYEVIAIGAWAFFMGTGTPTTNATLLSGISMPQTLKVIGDQAFQGQCGITSLEIPDSVISIGTDTFKSMNTNGGVNGTQGYAGCTGAASTGLRNLIIGSGVNSFGSYPFYAANNLTNVVFRGSPSDLKSLDRYTTNKLDQWEFTNIEVSNYNLNHPISDYSRNSCSLFFVYAGALNFSILATQSTSWQYWAQGCLGGTLTLQSTLFKPSRPISPTVSEVSLTAALVSFTPPSSDGGSPITSYSVLYSSDDWATSTTASSTISSASASYSVTGLTPSTSYKFKMIATNSIGSSLSSQTSSVVNTLAPFAPGAPTIGIVAGTSATTLSIPYTAGAINGSAITGYTTTSSPSVSLTLTSAATANPLTYSGTFVQGQAYTFSMTATNGAGTSSSSSSSNSITPYAAAAPAAGIIGSVTSSSAATVSIPFTAPSSNGSSITAYTITSSPALTLTYSGTTSPMAVTGAFVQGQSYAFTIAATNGAGTGAASSASNSVTPFAPGNPDAPTIGVATTVDSQTVTVSFSAPTNNRGSVITSYTATSNPGGITGTSSTSPITITGLTVNTPYTFTVTATNGVGTSDSSTATSAVTPRMVYSVTFDSQGGSTVSSESFLSGASVSTAPTSPTRSGYTFNGWFAASTGGSSLQFPYSPGVTSNITVYAQWTLIPVVVPPAPIPTPVVVTGPPPSILKTLISPKISRDENVYYCEIGKYVFLREGRTEEAPKLTTQVFSLLLNGKVIETQKSSLAKVSFTKSDSYFNSTLACQVEVGQENLSTTSYSLNSDSMTSHSLTKKKAIEAADAKYYKDRQDAYAKKDLEFARLLAIKTTAIATSKSSKDTLAASLAYQKAFTAASNLWKKELADASTNRVLAKELAQKQYLDALEAAGVSIYPVPAKAVVAPVPEPVPTPTPTPSPSVINVQPTAAMKKVGTFYMASGSYFLNDASKISLKALALKINATEVKQVLVYGHTDIRGGVNNTWLSQQRAKAVASYLRPLLRDKKLVIGWYASSKPMTTGTSSSDLAKNRRVEIYTK